MLEMVIAALALSMAMVAFLATMNNLRESRRRHEAERKGMWERLTLRQPYNAPKIADYSYIQPIFLANSVETTAD